MIRDAKETIDKVYNFINADKINIPDESTMYCMQKVMQFMFKADIYFFRKQMKDDNFFKSLDKSYQTKIRVILSVDANNYRYSSIIEEPVDMNKVNDLNTRYFNGEKDVCKELMKYKYILLYQKYRDYSSEYRDRLSNIILNNIIMKMQGIAIIINSIEHDTIEGCQHILDLISKNFDITENELYNFKKKYLVHYLISKESNDYYTIIKFIENYKKMIGESSIEYDIFISHKILKENIHVFEAYSNFGMVNINSIKRLLGIGQPVLAKVIRYIKAAYNPLYNNIKEEHNNGCIVFNFKKILKIINENKDIDESELYGELCDTLKKNFPLGLYNYCIDFEYNESAQTVVNYLNSKNALEKDYTNLRK